MTMNKQADLNIRNMALITPLNNLSYSEKHRELHANLSAFPVADSLLLCTARHVIKIQHCFHCYQVAICLILTSWLKKNTEKHFAKLHFRVWTTTIYSVLYILYACLFEWQIFRKTSSINSCKPFQWVYNYCKLYLFTKFVKSKHVVNNFAPFVNSRVLNIWFKRMNTSTAPLFPSQPV